MISSSNKNKAVRVRKKRPRKQKYTKSLDFAELQQLHGAKVESFIERKWPLLCSVEGAMNADDLRQTLWERIIIGENKFNPETYLTTSSIADPDAAKKQISDKQADPEVWLIKGRKQWAYGAMANWARRFLSETHPDKKGGRTYFMNDLVDNLAGNPFSAEASEETSSAELSSSRYQGTEISETDTVSALLEAANDMSTEQVKEFVAALSPDKRAEVMTYAQTQLEFKQSKNETFSEGLSFEVERDEEEESFNEESA